jgi:hypothetical protein
MQSFFLTSRRARLAGLHLIASLVVATATAVVVFAVWYPPPFATIAGGVGLFMILISVDVVLGPVLTAVVADPAKPRNSLRRDIAVIAAVQLAGLAYGVHAIAMSRPVHLAFEVDRIRVVTAADVDTETLAEAPPGLRELPWTGPTLIAAAKPTNPDDVFKSIELAMNGFDISMFPRHWREYDSQRDAAWNAARPLADLIARYPSAAPDVEKLAARIGQPVSDLRFLPLISRHASWATVVSAPDARIVGHLPWDGFL